MFFIATYYSAINAQENTSKIDSLVTELTQLKHDYNYLYCLNELEELDSSLRIFIHGLDISSNSVLLNYYQRNYDRRLYNAYKDNHQSSKELLDNLKVSVSVSKMSVAAKMIDYDFNEREIMILEGKMHMIESCVEKAEGSLDYFDLVIDMYKKRY